jgi:uncharacterized protein (DUF58 family)
MGAWQILKHSAHRRWSTWIARRIPPAHKITLTHRSIFIFPSKMGFVFLVLLLLMFILAVNYQNALTHALVFFLGSLFFVSIHHTYRNLSSLQLIAVPASACFVGDTLKLQVRLLDALEKDHYQIKLQWQTARVIDVISPIEQQVSLDYPAQHRGICRPERLRVSTQYPLGLLEAWTWVDLVYDALVYPLPIKEPFRYITAASDQVHQGQALQKGFDDFHGFRTYQSGDNLKHIAWKQVARGQGLLTKVFEDHLEHTHWLDWAAVGHGDTEYRLSVLCGWVLASHELNYEYGLKLPHKAIEPSRGDAHRDQCLKSLALYDLEQAVRPDEGGANAGGDGAKGGLV